MVLGIGYGSARAKIFRVSAMLFLADSGVRESWAIIESGS